jgi:tetratricopeptide (TPR) repeat protein
MATRKVLKMEEHRGRRLERLRLAEALYRPNQARHTLFGLISEVAELTQADRAAAVWVDEYGSGLVHPHVVVDLLADRPRRHYAVEPLKKAWDLGLPGAYDEAVVSGNGHTSTLAIALGSDGTRAWFLVADSVTGRGRLDSAVRERVLFLAGECSSIVLHRDLESLLRAQKPGADRFTGWPVLEDLEDLDASEADAMRIEGRFLLARLIRKLVDDDLTASPDALGEQVLLVRAEIDLVDGAEAVQWRGILEALESQSYVELARRLVEAGEVAESSGHRHGALELYDCAYEIAAGVSAPSEAVDAARFRARMQRRRAEWDEAARWYGIAEEIARAAGLVDRAARVLMGLATIRKETGNLPAARERLMAALSLADSGEVSDTRAGVHQELLSLEHAAGNLPVALEHGWVAVAECESEVQRIRCLASLAGALVDFGDREAAEDAWSVVAQQSDEVYYRAYAYDALAYLAALRGDGEAFEAYAAKCDGLGWQSGSESAAAEILHYRGLSYRALDRMEDAEAWLSRAVSFAEKHGFNRTLFEAEEALKELRTSVTRVDPMPAAPPEVREGLRAMRGAVVAVDA